MPSPVALLLPKEGRGWGGFCVLGFHLRDSRGRQLSSSWRLYFSLPRFQFFSAVEGGFGDEHQAHHTGAVRRTPVGSLGSFVAGDMGTDLFLDPAHRALSV